ncbi:hypothetical protein PAXRUDRAFT_824784 [Paxillus rubicundulus Ve08.2h10]|uniref:Uncharacterized protein n=1 Tax=Paxillus rubicundulus Ve08.2h10 TaxID=930991 RepID=A0A0D0EBG4_9AGAM|nr:hypothetical protein PAXRUDRAFT_824784 [Paxillus rubicundulus Ve08.2h10]
MFGAFGGVPRILGMWETVNPHLADIGTVYEFGTPEYDSLILPRSAQRDHASLSSSTCTKSPL